MRTSIILSSVLGYTKKLFKNAIFQILSLIVALGSIGITYAAWTTLTASQGADGQPVTQTLMQGIINNLNDLDARFTAVNPSGTTLSGSSICIGATCKTTWPGSGSAQWGGSYWWSNYDGCRGANPLTSACTCPTGFTSYLAYNILLTWEFRLYQCYKL